MSNYPPLEHRPKGSRLPEGEWFNDIIDRVNAITEDPLPQAGPSPAINFTGTTVAGSKTVSGIADTTGLAAGQEITGVGIQALTTIASVGPSSLTLSQIASYSNTTPMQAYPAGISGAVPPSPARATSPVVLGANGWEGRSPNSWLYKFDDPRRFARFRAAVGGVMSGRPVLNTIPPLKDNTGRNVLIFGDSAAIGNEPYIGYWTMSPWYGAFNLLSDRNLGAFRYDAITQSGYALASEDPRVVMNGAWHGEGQFPSLPGVLVNSADTADLVITPSLPWDTMDLIYRSFDSSATWTYKIGAGSPVPVSQVGQNDSVFRKITVTAEEVASQTLTINRTSGNVQIVYQNPYDSTKPQIRAINLGSGGGSVAQLKGYNFTNQQSPANLKTLFDPALVIFHYGYEIAGQRASPGVPAATMVAEFISNMSAEIEAWQALGVDVMLMSMHPWSDEYPDGLYRDQATVLQGREAIYQIADTFDLPLIDNYSRWGSHEEAFAAGLIEHFARPLPAGDWDLARAAAFALSSV